MSIAIVLYYLYVRNSWRVQYKRPKYRDLGFKNEDFDFAFTNDIIFRYIKELYPDDWETRCTVLLQMEMGAMRKYYEGMPMGKK